MLNENGTRELAYLVKVDEIRPIEGAEKVELAVVGGWHIMVHKEEFHVGDIGVYFEIDSKLPEVEPFMFLEKYHFRVKTQKYLKGTVLSQGLLMSLDDFMDESGRVPAWVASTKIRIANGENVEHTFLTEILGVTYATAEDNARKANPDDKYKRMAQRHPQIFKQGWARWLMRRNWGKRLLFIFFGRKTDKKVSWIPNVKKTDEERCQNLIYGDLMKGPWIATEKIDGSSTTAYYEKKGKKKHYFVVCSRNVVFDKPDKKCFYDTNIYTEMAEKYNFESVLEDIANKYNLKWVALQGETYGAGVQNRNYSLSGHDFAGFNLIFSDRGRLNSVESKEIMAEYSIPWVPIVDENFYLPDTVDELLEIADGVSIIDGGMREGLVFRSQDGVQSFKAVSNQFLLKFHQ